MKNPKRDKNLKIMRKVNEKELEWIKNNPKEFVDEFSKTLQLISNFHHLIEPIKGSGNEEEYKRRFKELLQIERDTLNQNKG
jgi:hypothetical protein